MRLANLRSSVLCSLRRFILGPVVHLKLRKIHHDILVRLVRLVLLFPCLLHLLCLFFFSSWLRQDGHPGLPLELGLWILWNRLHWLHPVKWASNMPFKWKSHVFARERKPKLTQWSSENAQKTKEKGGKQFGIAVRPSLAYRFCTKHTTTNNFSPQMFLELVQSKRQRLQSCMHLILQTLLERCNLESQSTSLHIPTIPIHCLLPLLTLSLSSRTTRSAASPSSLVSRPTWLMPSTQSWAKTCTEKKQTNFSWFGSQCLLAKSNSIAANFLYLHMFTMLSHSSRKDLGKTGRRAHPHLFSRSHKSVSSETSGMFSRKKIHADKWHQFQPWNGPSSEHGSDIVTSIEVAVNMMPAHFSMFFHVFPISPRPDIIRGAGCFPRVTMFLPRRHDVTRSQSHMMTSWDHNVSVRPRCDPAHFSQLESEKVWTTPNEPS